MKDPHPTVAMAVAGTLMISMANPNTEEMFSVGLMVIDSIMEQFM